MAANSFPVMLSLADSGKLPPTLSIAEARSLWVSDATLPTARRLPESFPPSGSAAGFGCRPRGC